MPDTAVITDFPRKVREIENTWIPMPDGTKLAARIWLPEDAEDDPVPAILEYLPYRKRDGTVARDHLTHPYFAGHGYAGVRVDMRGTGDSEGVCLGEYLLQEQDDALAILDWIAAQPWCTGKVGMIGISWGGFNGLQIAARQPPALAAVVTLCSTDDRYADDMHFMGGCLLTDNLSWASTMFAYNTPPDPAIVGERWRDMWLERLAAAGSGSSTWLRHQRRDAYWRHGSICEDYGACSCPVLRRRRLGGRLHQRRSSGCCSTSTVRAGLVGPWAHKYPHRACPARASVSSGMPALVGPAPQGHRHRHHGEPMIRAWMQDPTPPDPAPVERPGRWVAEPAWPSASTETLSLHVTPDGLADAPAGPVVIDCPETAGHAASVWCQYGAGSDGPLDQSAETGFMQVFDTAPLDRDLEILGFPMLRLSVASDVPQANLAAVLSLVAPDGKATLVTFGVLNLTHRDSHADPSPLPHGTPVDATLQLNVIGQRLPAGHRLRLALSQAYWPILWPSATKARLTLQSARLDLPLRPARDEADLPAFGPPEGAAPLETEVLEPGGGHRTRMIDYATGTETHERHDDTGLVTHLHTGITLRARSWDTFHIHPDDPNSATCTCRWEKSFARDGWHTELETEVTVAALPDVWRITATLVARDGDGVVAERQWAEDIPRDLA
jgi:predicted acyl esterase